MINRFLDLLVAFLSLFSSKPDPKPSDPTQPSDPPKPDDDVEIGNKIIEELHKLHNNKRNADGVPPLKVDSLLMTAAANHANWMARNGRMSHTGESNSSFWDRIISTGYNGTSGGENIAAGYNSAESVMGGWMRSNGHRRNILNPRWIEVGYGLSYAGSTPYWCTVFAVPSRTGIQSIVVEIDKIELPEPISEEEEKKE